ncbi:MAG TPA: hypothetical protein VM580_06810, partial [Labilithrix sp.]|nr:hypothetical protein [Labilithrix sp.]
DPDTAFPPRTCNAQVAACMESRLAKGDVSTCGRYREVSTCIAGPSECLFGWTVDQLFSNAGFSGLGYQRIQAGTTYPIEVQNQVIAAAKQRDPSVTTMAAALALGGGFVARHQVQRLATGARYDAVVFTASDQKMYGAVFRADTTTAAASVKNGFLANCTLLRAEGGVQIGDDCSAQMPCGQGLLCLGVNANVGFGKCVPTEYVAGEGSWCGEIDGSYVSCPSDELVCGSGLCVPAFMHGEFDDGSVTTLTPGGTTTRTIEAYGLATVGMETWVSAALSNVVPSSIILRVMNSSGTLVTLYDGPELALTEPDIDSDNFVEFSELARFPGDESANGTYTLFVETTAGHPAGELLNWHLSVTSRYD